MTTYYFKILILGGEADTSHFYISQAFGEPGEDQETYFKWYKEIKVLDDTCDLEIDAITSISADLDEIIPMVDGIIYFLNPVNEVESELFEMILPDIFSVKRDIPTIVMFYDQNGILPIPVNDLLTHIWVNFPNLEAYINLSPNNFHQSLQSLCLAMINGDTPLNIENAWMRFPIFIEMANVYFNNQNYYYAAQAVRKAALIAEIYNKDEYYIISEQAAYLYSKINLYLEASKILEKVDKRKSLNFKKLYADAMIREANLAFNRNEFERAAKNYELAAQWSSIELLDKTFINEAFKLGINSWISACRVDNALRILDNLPHQEVTFSLKEISDKIAAAADYLVSINNIESAKEQLYLAINKYQREALSDELKTLTKKLADVLITLITQQVSEEKKHAAKNTYDELENMWESYKVKKENLDSTLEKLINQFFKANSFGMATILIDKLNSRELKQKLAKTRDEFEDKYEALKKKEVEEYINKGIGVIRDFFEAEFDIITEMNKEKIAKANEFVEGTNYLKASNLLKKQAESLKKIGKEEIRDQILTKSLDILLDGLLFQEFFLQINELSGEQRANYLRIIFPKYLQQLEELKNIEDYNIKSKIFENSIKIYRDQMLYDQSKEISLSYIEVIKEEALTILETEEDLDAINKADDLVKNVETLLLAYLDKEENINITFNKIYKKIAEIYIKFDELHLAQVYNDKIEKKAYKTEIHQKIAELEDKKSKIRTKKAKETREEEEIKEKRSIIENRAREALLDKEKELKERKGHRRAYFRDGLNYLKNQEYDKAFEVYRTSTDRLIKINKYNLAGVSLAIASLILMKENKLKEVKDLLNETKKAISGLGKLLSDTFAVTLLEYVIGMKSVEDEQKFKDTLSFYEYLPLFEEELALLSDYLGEDLKLEKEVVEVISKEEEIKEMSREEIGRLSKLQVEIEQRYGKIESKKVDAKRDKDNILKKRKPMKKRYYSPILVLITSHKFNEAAMKYLELANNLYKRKDFRTCSLMVLYHGLALLKSGESLKNIKKKINEFLNTLGVNKNLVKETFYIMLFLFLIDIKLYNFDVYFPKIKEMMKFLPLFEEENVLIEFEAED